MATNRKQFQRKHGGDIKQTDLNPLKLPPDSRKRSEGWTNSDEPVGEDLPDDLPRSPSSAVRYRQPTGSLRGIREQDDDPDTTRQIPGSSRRTSQAYSGLPGQMRVRAGRNTTIDIPQQPQKKAPANRSMHWLLYIGVGMIAALALWLIFSSVLAWGVGKYNDIVYGYPRYYQIDAVVGHNDSPAHPSHFVALNLHGQVIVIELPGGNPTKSYDYVGPSMIASGDDRIPVILTFSDVHHNGKPDMFIHIQDHEFYFCNDGTKFVTCNAP